jgi:pyruvate dehydrogenase E2 component (dihydrolipoamide acetyltransferase)
MGRADRIIPVQHMADLPGHVALHLLNGVGHMPHIEANELLARLIKDHMGSIN